MRAWELFSRHAGQADSIGEWLVLIFVTIVQMRDVLWILLQLLLATALVLAVTKPQVRRSRVAQVGFSVLATGVLPLLWVGALVTENPAGLGMLFALLSPIAVFLIVTGTILSLKANQESTS